ncbi:MAG: DUF4956 domain-containing protein [Crocinitomicaceae bacterium]|jgi:hypothetical protein|nr:DUF4956 domain-containing protein [Crocinitomicaceae bacterium]MDG2463787.1 DUF4956 domain-containing protein [Crocinitomicaceae bacterium]
MGGKAIEDSLGWVFFDTDVYTLLMRLAINLFVLTVVIRYLYYPKTKRKDYLFTYYIIGIITFFICFSLKKLDIDTGMGLGLFAIFGIIRYRTNTVEIKEMTYLFLVIGLSVINSLASNNISLLEVIVVNGVMILLTAGLEYLWLLKHETRKTIVYERIDLIKPESYDEMMADLVARTGLNINRFEVGKINFLRDVAQVMIYYYESDQSFSDYSAQEGSSSSYD